MSQIVIKNQTGENIRVAIFKQNYKQPTLETVAWQIVAPPQDGQDTIPISSSYEVFVNYPGPNDSLTNPYAGYQTNRILTNTNTGRFIVTSSHTDDGNDIVASISQSSQDVVRAEMHIVNQAGFGVWGHITSGGSDIYLPRVIAPGSIMLEDVRSTFYLAVVSLFVYKGQRLVEEELSSPPIPILIGQTASVTGSIWSGYAIGVSGG